MNRNKGFTLVEILIVVIILGILAAVVVPQFTQASDDARASSLKTDLQTVRSQLELYRVQEGTYPTEDPSGPLVADGYLQKFPTNPFVNDNTVEVVTGADGTGTGDGSTGWWYNSDTGEFGPNDADHLDW